MGDELFGLQHQPDWRTKQQHDVESALEGKDFTVWVAEDEGAVVGFAAATIRSNEDMGEIHMVAVDPGNQNTHVGEGWVSSPSNRLLLDGSVDLHFVGSVAARYRSTRVCAFTLERMNLIQDQRWPNGL
jgi:hypothetical protein